MKDFTLSGPAWFDSAPEPVIWTQGDTIAYLNQAARELSDQIGFQMAEGERLPDCLLDLPKNATTAISCKGTDWLCRVEPAAGGALLQFSPAYRNTELTFDRLGQIAVQMRVPLGNVIGAIQLLENPNKSLSPVKRAQYEAIQRKNYYVLLRMLDNLEFLGASNKATFFQPTILDFGGLCADVVRSAEALARQANKSLELESPDGNLLVLGDEGLLRRLLYHLLSNALRAVDEGGRVAFRLLRRGGVARLLVHDTGAGFEPWQLLDVFDPSSAAGDPLEPDHGIGIGISICRMIVERHKGRIALLTGTGQGRAVVELPLAASVEQDQLRQYADYSGGLSEPLMELADVLPWQCFAAEQEE